MAGPKKKDASTRDPVLVVDDSAVDLETIGSLLFKRNFDVISVRSARAAWAELQKYQKPPFVAIFVDIMMPEIDGIEFIEWIREHEKYSHIPIVVVTSHAKQEYVLKTVKLKVNGFMVKPVTPEKISKQLSLLYERQAKRIVRVLRGKSVFDVGSVSQNIYHIQEGHVCIYKRAVASVDVPVGLVGPGEYLGEMSLLSETAHTSKAVALTDVKMHVFKRTEIEILLENTPMVITSLVTDLIQRLQKTNEILKSNNFKDPNLEKKILELST